MAAAARGRADQRRGGPAAERLGEKNPSTHTHRKDTTDDPLGVHDF